MDTRYLENFIAVVDAGSIAEAARQLDLAPTTLAQQLRALETDLGLPLVTRVGRTVSPTVAGSRILDQARKLVRAASDLRASASNDNLPPGPFRLGATPTAIAGLLPPLMRAWAVSHPGIQIYVVPGTSSTLLSRVTSGDLDAALLVHPLFELPKTCAWHLMRDEPLILLAPTRLRVDDPLLTAAREPFIQYDREVVGGRLAADYLKGRGIRPKVQFELDGIEQISVLVSEGFGVSVLPDWPGRPDGHVRRWTLPAPCPSRRVGMVWLRSSPRLPLAQALHSLVRAESVIDRLNPPSEPVVARTIGSNRPE
jgi:DNA-binding transcriptional LysR family regulator